MKKNLLIFIAAILLAQPSNAFTAPAIEKLALNHKTKQCARYWSGDEFTFIELPTGWVSFPIIHTDNNPNTIKTDVGECIYTSFKECCEKLGYEHLDVRNIGKNNQNYSSIVIAIAVMGGVALLIYFYKKKF
jgi:hypothetical protein